jgi:cell division protein FtsQ
VARESELYPQEALADAERRYLRRQKPLEIRRRRFSQRGWPAVRRWMVGITAAACGVFLLYQVFHFFLFSPAVKLSAYDQIEVVGNHYVSRAAVTERFVPDLGRSILRVPLDERRAALESLPWVSQARVQRVLPNHIRVELTERTPVAFLRSTSGLALVDADGVILDRPLEADFHFPVVTGLSEAMPRADRQKRMLLFLDFLRDIELVRPGASDGVSEVDLADASDLRATLTGLPPLESEETLLVRFGDQDFVNKYRLLTENLDQWLARSGHLESVDLRFSRQVVVNPEQETAAARPDFAK